MTLSRILIMVVVVAVAIWMLNAMGLINKTGGQVRTEMPRTENIDPYARGQAAFMSLQYATSLSAYQEGLRNNPEHPEAATAMYRIAKCYEELRQDGLALEAYRTYLKNFPNDDATRVQAARKRVALLSGSGG